MTSTFNTRYHQMKTFRWWYWALVPLLAIAAYATVLRIGFLADDFIFLYNSQQSGIDLSVFVPEPHWYIYRPLGVVLVGQLGWQLWGYNPLGYHLVSLILHSGSSLLLGLLVAEISSRRALGWLTGALFAVFPLHLEAVGWMSAQWDAWSVLFGLASLWFFSIWWRGSHETTWRYIYLLFSAFLYCLAIFTKENLLSFIVIFPVAAYAMNSRNEGASRFNRSDWRRLALGLIPLLAVLMLNIGIRLSAWGFLGGYRGARNDYLNFFWDAYGALIRMLLAPINSTLLGSGTAQVVGALSCVGLLVGFLCFGYREPRLLLLGATWIVVPLVPVLNLGASVTDLQQNRFLYMATAGYCFTIAVLLYGFVAQVSKWRSAYILVGLILLASVAACWAHLRPWHTASVQVKDVDRQLSTLLPPVRPGEDMVWFAENTPDNYQGAYSLRVGLGSLPYFRTGQNATVNGVVNATDLHLLEEQDNAFAMRFRYDQLSTRYVIDYASGITSDAELPSEGESSTTLQTWDFRGCSSGAVAVWTVRGAESSCKPESGLTLSPTNPDPQVLSPPPSISSGLDQARFVRVRASVIYPPADHPEPYISEWYWKGPGEEWSAERSLAVPIKQDGVSHVYWTFIPIERAPQGISELRFDPVNGAVDSTVQWIAVDEVP